MHFVTIWSNNIGGKSGQVGKNTRIGQRRGQLEAAVTWLYRQLKALISAKAKN